MKSSNKNNEYLIERAYQDHFEHLYSYALLLVKSEDLAKDVVAEVFYNLLNANTDISAIQYLKSYLLTCIRNQAIRMKTKDPYYTEKENDFVSMDKINPEELLIGKELDRFLEKAIDDLPPQCRLVFKMVKENQMKYSEVASELGISVDTVKYHLKTALKSIRTKLENHFDDTKVISWFSSAILLVILTNMVSQL